MEKKFFVFFVPKRSLICEQMIEEKGFSEDIKIGELKIDFIPLDSDVLSLEMSNSFKNIYVDHDESSIFAAARGIVGLQAAHGIIPRICGKGSHSRRLADMIMKMKVDVSDVGLASNIEALVILERGCDYGTALMTQLTYEGLLDEFFNIKQSQIQVDGLKDVKKVQLQSNDSLYSQIRDLNFSAVGSTLNKIARKLNDDYDERHQAKTVSQIRQFIGKLGNLQSEHKSLQIRKKRVEHFIDTNLAEILQKNTKEMDFLKTLEWQQSK